MPKGYEITMAPPGFGEPGFEKADREAAKFLAKHFKSGEDRAHALLSLSNWAMLIVQWAERELRLVFESQKSRDGCHARQLLEGEKEEKHG